MALPSGIATSVVGPARRRTLYAATPSPPSRCIAIELQFGQAAPPETGNGCFVPRNETLAHRCCASPILGDNRR
jgi:hypothetical protein